MANLSGQCDLAFFPGLSVSQALLALSLHARIVLFFSASTLQLRHRLSQQFTQSIIDTRSFIPSRNVDRVHTHIPSITHLIWRSVT
ncbi:hypothetical protein VTJ04DRAFT_5817 [Mycothermus thermophilus]|uniref:uncharacterized protein n=1 Tax=Humicola insolens TaxID=85995 RepID=UPI003742994C